jgi:sulfate adenylyltransferase
VPDAPQYSPSPRELDDLELIVSGALSGPLDAGLLALPEAVQAAALDAGAVELVDPEGLPLARVSWPNGEVTPLARPAHGPFRRLYLTPDEARRQHPDGFTVVFVGGVSDQPALLRHALARYDAVVAVPLAADDPRRGQVLAAYGHPEVAPPVELPRPPRSEQGLVLFFTGLSGSGKSTLARALMDRLLEAGERTVTSLDGDVVRRNLSAGLGFSREDRETNIRRIGWVAAEIARHGGVAVCSPIAPFDATRQDVRRYVEDAGGAFFLIHVATPLAECERRDRKGLYARARAGEIPDFTGISSPYEVPADADVTVDTTGRSIEDALGDVLAGLREAGYLDLSTAESDPSTAKGDLSTAEGDLSTERVGLKVLFVCTANICRSPFMELTARALAGDARVSFASAGTHGFDASPMDDALVRVLAEGVDASEFRSRPLTRELLEDADLVLTAEAAHRSFILDDHPGLFRKVFTLGQAAEAVARLEPGLTPSEVVARLGAARGSADPALDVPDPYRRGPEAAAAAAERITALLRALLPALTGTRS